MNQEIEVTSNNYNNYIGKYSAAMISNAESDFTIIFQNKDIIAKNLENVDVESIKEVNLPLLIIEHEEIIKKSIPDVRILYNHELNIETILTGYIIGKIYRNEDIKSLNELLIEKIDVLYKDNELIDSLKPLIDEASTADDYDFSTIEDKMYNLISNKLQAL